MRQKFKGGEISREAYEEVMNGKCYNLYVRNISYSHQLKLKINDSFKLINTMILRIST